MIRMCHQNDGISKLYQHTGIFKSSVGLKSFVLYIPILASSCTTISEIYPIKLFLKTDEIIN